MCVSFVGPVVIRRENRNARRIDRITDVLSFPMLDMTDGQTVRRITDADVDDPGSAQRRLFLGDILICIDQASRQAIEYGHSLEREIAFLALHGMLHLFGYDHDTGEREQQMIKRQNELLELLELSREASVTPK